MGRQSTDRQWAVRPDNSPKVANNTPFQLLRIGQEIGQIEWESGKVSRNIMML